MKTKKSIVIFLTDVIPLIIISIIGIFKLKIFLQVLGDETLGLYQLFNQIMVYVALVDGGLSSAVLHALYKPNVEKDDKTLYSILLGTKRVFSLIGIIVFVVVVIIASIVPYFIKDNTFDYSYIVIAFIIYSLSNVIAYFFMPSQACLEVKEEKHIVNLFNQGGQIIQGILEIVLLLNGYSFIDLLIMHSIIKMLSFSLTGLINYKKYKNPYKNIKPDYSFMKQLKHLIFHKVNGLVGSNIDVIIISKLLGLASVAIYSTYNYIFNMLKTIIGKFSASTLAIVGNYMVKDKEKVYSLFKELTNMMFYVAIVVCVPLIFAISSFISVWYEGQIETSFYIGFAFALLLTTNIIKQPIVTIVHAGALFKETKFCALVDTITNLSLSLILVFKYGIPGVIFATTISVMISEYTLKTIVIYKNIFKKNAMEYFLNNMKFFAIMFVDIIIGIIIFKNMEFANIFVWFGMFIAYFIVNALFILFVFYIIKSLDFMDRIKYLLKRN